QGGPEVASRTRTDGHQAIGMPEDDAGLLGADRAPEDTIHPALVALVVRPLRQLLGARRMPDASRALPHHEAEHDAQRLGVIDHGGRVVPRCALGRQERCSRRHAVRRRPRWTPPERPSMTNAVSTDRPQPEGRSFASFNLPAPVMEGIRAAGFTHCTPIQEKVLPLSLAGRDVAGQAQTGTGKTAAFLITIFTRLLRHARGIRASGPRAFVIAPTRELVVQITEDARLLGQATGLTVHAVFGGVDYKKQRDQLLGGVDLLVGT